MNSARLLRGRAGLGGFVRRVAMQAAISTTVMTGLHVAASQGLSPADWLLAPREPADRPSPVAAPAREAADRGPGEGSPDIRFIAIPAAEAFPNGYGPAARPPMQQTTPTILRAAIQADEPTQRAARPRREERDEGGDLRHVGTPPLPAIVAIPTPRPVPRNAVPRLETEPVEVADATMVRRPFDPEPAKDGPELARDATLEPPTPQDEGLGLRTRILERGMLMRGAATVGLHARDAIEGAALGAMAIVGAR